MSNDNSKMNGGMGEISCPVADDWLKHTIKSDNAIKKVDAMHELLETIQGHTMHLEKLDNLDLLVKAVAGKNEGENKLMLLMAKIFGGVVIALSLVIVFLLTGQHLGWFALH